MSERQEDKRERSTQLRIQEMMRNGWGDIDPQIVERFATNSPAGVMNEWNLRPGSVLSPEQFNLLMNNLRGTGDPGSSNRGYLGAQNLTPEQYLSDPRSAVRLENGQYVYRPELSAQATGGEDFYGINPSGFWNNADLVSMLPLIAVGAGPYAASLGAAGAGAAAGAGETGIGGWAGAIGEGGTLSGVSDLGWNVAGLAGEGAGAGALDGINWASDIFNPDALSTFTGDTSAGWNVAGTSGGTGGAIADGINWASDIFDPNAASGFTGDASAGWNVAQTAGGTGGAVAQQAAKTGLSKFLKDKFNLDVDQNTLGMLGQLGGAGIGLLGSKQQSDALTNLQNQLSGQRAPFLNKAVGYLNNPDSFYTSPEATGAANATMRALSTKFGNPGTSPTAQSLATGALYDRYTNTVNSLGSLGLSGQGIQANLGQQIASTSGQPYAIAGNTISGLTSDNSMDDMMKRMFRQQFGLP
jgi:hypothetical protein